MRNHPKKLVLSPVGLLKLEGFLFDLGKQVGIANGNAETVSN